MGRPWFNRRPPKGDQRGDQSGGKSGEQNAKGGGTSKVGVLEDYVAMKAADWATRHALHAIELSNPDLVNKIVVAARQFRTKTEAILVLALQGVGNILLPMVPGNYRDTAEDFLAKIPTAVTNVVADYARREVSPDVRIAEGDLKSLHTEITQVLSGTFPKKITIPLNLIELLVRGKQDNVDYISTLLNGVGSMSPLSKDSVEKMLADGKVDDIIKLLQLGPDALRKFNDTLSLFERERKQEGNVVQRAIAFVHNLFKHTPIPDADVQTARQRADAARNRLRAARAQRRAHRTRSPIITVVSPYVQVSRHTH